MILSDFEIKEYVKKYKMIDPFDDTRLGKIKGKISWGLSSYGYDIRLSEEFMCPKKVKKNIEIDPKNFNSNNFYKVNAENYTIPPNSYILGRSLEFLKIPRNIIAVVFGKSTYARCGLIVNITPFEPEWDGYVTISIINPTNNKIKIYANEGIAQVIFLKSKKLCEISYKDKLGKYQAQMSITPPK